MSLDLLRSAAREVCHRADRSGQPCGISLRLDAGEPVDATRLFDAAARRSKERFYAARPSENLEILGLGAAFVSMAHGPDCLARVRTEVTALRAGWHGEVDAVRLVGNAAFRGLTRAQREPAWRDFGSARFVLPTLLWRREHGHESLIVSFTAAPGEDPTRVRDRVERELAGFFEKDEPVVATANPGPALEPQVPQGFEASARAIVAAIGRREARKVVLAGVVDRQLRNDLASARVLENLRREQPHSLTFALGSREPTFLGATPEALIRRRDLAIEACAVAGTARRLPEADADARSSRNLLASSKDAFEHQLVVDALREALAAWAALEEPAAPVLLDAGPVRHLCTPVRGRLRQSRHLLELAADLHPTPALGGVPRKAALELIERFEAFDRGGYGGPVGWFGFDGCGELDVALRCALVERRHARLYAGSGLVGASCIESEMRETADKLRTLGDWLESAS